MDRIYNGRGGNEILGFDVNTLTDKSAPVWDGCITHELWSPSELCSSSQTSNNKMFIAPKSIICCVQTIHSVWYFPLKSLLLISLFCRLVTPGTMMSFLCTEFSDTNLIHRFEIYILIWDIHDVYIHSCTIRCSIKNTEQIFWLHLFAL